MLVCPFYIGKTCVVSLALFSVVLVSQRFMPGLDDNILHKKE